MLLIQRRLFSDIIIINFCERLKVNNIGKSILLTARTIDYIGRERKYRSCQTRSISTSISVQLTVCVELVAEELYSGAVWGRPTLLLCLPAVFVSHPFLRKTFVKE